MVSPVKTQTGSCPHGMPAGACPICSGRTGGGGGSSLNTPRRVGEMSWNQCYFEGLMMKKEAVAKQEAIQLNQQAALLNSIAQNKMLAPILNAVTQMTQFMQNVQNVLQKPISAVVQDALQFVANLVKDVSSFLKTRVMSTLANAFEGIKSQFINITDKLTAIFGEMKNALVAKFEKGLERVKRKLSSLFSFLSLEVEKENEDEELKKIFSLKTMSEKLKFFLMNKKEPKQ